MDCQLTFNKIIHYLTLYDVVKLRLVCKKWNRSVTNDELYWKFAYKNFLINGTTKNGIITMNDFKEEYLQFYDEPWIKKLHSFVLKKSLCYTLDTKDYMEIYTMLYKHAISNDNAHDLMIKVVEMMGNTKDQTLINSVKSVCSYLIRCSYPKIEF